MRKILVATAIATSIVSTPAFAQEAPSFSGFHIEALMGLDSVRGSIDEDVYGEEYSESSNGFGYGVGIGYDFMVGESVVIGLEGELSESTVGENADIEDLDVEGYILNGTASLDASEDLYVGARLGVVLGTSTLLYTKAGYSMANAKASAVGTVDGEPDSAEVNLGLNGFRVGAGLEQQFSKNFFAKLEYRYTNYSGGELEYEGEELSVDDAFDYIGLDRHQVVFGIGFRF